MKNLLVYSVVIHHRQLFGADRTKQSMQFTCGHAVRSTASVFNHVATIYRCRCRLVADDVINHRQHWRTAADHYVTPPSLKQRHRRRAPCKSRKSVPRQPRAAKGTPYSTLLNWRLRTFQDSLNVHDCTDWAIEHHTLSVIFINF